MKRPAHRPASIDAKRVNVTLDQQTIEAARKIGNGNVSAGIRIAVKEALTK
jgi:post-segregation antitoxin (ccd killing protein)